MASEAARLGTGENENGGAEGIRTPDPHNAIVVLYQLSYDPIQCSVSFKENAFGRKAKNAQSEPSSFPPKILGIT
jgi:hypothetical protein